MPDYDLKAQAPAPWPLASTRGRGALGRRPCRVGASRAFVDHVCQLMSLGTTMYVRDNNWASVVLGTVSFRRNLTTAPRTASPVRRSQSSASAVHGHEGCGVRRQPIRYGPRIGYEPAPPVAVNVEPVLPLHDAAPSPLHAPFL